MKAVIYARYSSDNQREESIEGQVRECKEYAKKRDISIVKLYIDRAFSARTADRPEFQRMIKDSDKGLFDAVIVWKLDRFSRDRLDSAVYKHILKKNGVQVISAKENIMDGPEGIILEAMLEGMAEYYSAELSEKVKRGLTENALKCKFNGGYAPYGYRVNNETRRLVIDPLEAAVVQEIFSKYDKGVSIRAIRYSLNERGIKTNLGMPFSYSKLGHMIRNRAYIGEYRFGDIIVPDGIPAIVDKELFERIQHRMKTYQNKSGKAKAHEEYLLTPKIFCGACGMPMVGECGTSRTKNRKHFYYKCSAAKHGKCTHHRGLKKDWLEELVVTATVNEVLKDDVVNRIANAIVELQGKEDTTIPTMLKQLSECEKSIENMLNAIQAGVLTASTKKRLEKLEAERDRLDTAIVEAQLKRPRFSKENIIQWINHFKYGDISDKEYQREVIDTFVNSVFVYDDRILLTYNYKDGSNTLILDEVNNTCGSDLESSTPPGKSRYHQVPAFSLK